tara:strand:+ start:1325 stop:1477 length:153 start_codon:yes stop_codon:yes gene_type:complete
MTTNGKLDLATKKKLKKSEKNGCQMVFSPVGWIRKVRKEVKFNMKGQTLC